MSRRNQWRRFDSMASRPTQAIIKLSSIWGACLKRSRRCSRRITRHPMVSRRSQTGHARGCAFGHEAGPPDIVCFLQEITRSQSSSIIGRVKRFVARGYNVSPSSIPMKASPCMIRYDTRKKEVKRSKKSENRSVQPDCD